MISFMKWAMSSHTCGRTHSYPHVLLIRHLQWSIDHSIMPYSIGHQCPNQGTSSISSSMRCGVWMDTLFAGSTTEALWSLRARTMSITPSSHSPYIDRVNFNWRDQTRAPNLSNIDKLDIHEIDLINLHTKGLTHLAQRGYPSRVPLGTVRQERNSITHLIILI